MRALADDAELDTSESQRTGPPSRKGPTTDATDQFAAVCEALDTHALDEIRGWRHPSAGEPFIS